MACESCAPSFFSAEKSTSCWSVACPGNASRIPNVSSDAVFSGRDVCACSRPSEFFMVDVTLPGGLQWVQCKACVEERCAPGEFLYGCGDAITSSAVPRGECFRCPAGTFATNSAHREKCDECSQVVCPAGTFLASCGGNTSGVCESCPRHTYAGAAGRGRKKCKPCGFLDLCGVGEVLEGCGPYSTGTCTTCAADAFSTTDGLYLSSLQFDSCSECAAQRCAPGEYLYGCGTKKDSTGKPLESAPGVCLPCPAGTFKPAGVRYDECVRCPTASCPGEPGQVYLDGCYGNLTGTCKSLLCTPVDARVLCSIAVQPKVASAVKVARGQGIGRGASRQDGGGSMSSEEFAPSDSDAFGSAVAWITNGHAQLSNRTMKDRVLAVSAARDAGRLPGEGAWRVGSVYVFQVAAQMPMPSAPPATPVRLAGPGDMLLLHHWQSEVCGLAAANGDAFGFALAGVGDVDGNGMPDLAISAPYRASPHLARVDAGAICLLLLHHNTSVAGARVLSLETLGSAQTEATAMLEQHASLLGCALAAIGDVNGDGVPDLAASACGVDDGAGAVLTVMLSADGLARSVVVHTAASAGLTVLATGGTYAQLRFGEAIAAAGDLDGDGSSEVAVTLAVTVGKRGPLVMLQLSVGGQLKHAVALKDTHTGDLASVPTSAITSAGDVGGDGAPDLLLGARGKLVLLETNNVTDLESGWTMQAIETGPDHLFEGLQGVMGVEIQSTFFGNALAVSPDLNGDYTNDVVVGLQGQTNPTGGDSFDGAVFILHLRPAAGVSMKLQ